MQNPETKKDEPKPEAKADEPTPYAKDKPQPDCRHNWSSGSMNSTKS